MAPRIDAHQHFWQLSQPFNYEWLKSPELAAIHRDFLPVDLAPHMKQVGIERSVFVQTQHNLAETRWALNLARDFSWIAGVVGWVDLQSEHCEEQVLEFRDDPKFVGVRHVTQDEPNDNFIVQDNVVRGLKTLARHRVPFDLLFYEKHLRHAATLARLVPELPLVINHLAKPRIRSREMESWLPHLREAARFPNVFCKLSGLITEADWSGWKAADLRPYVEAALECFGPRRCMFGSDWPVCELAGTYEQVHQALCDCLGPLSADELDRIFGLTAIGVYGLK